MSDLNKTHVFIASVFRRSRWNFIYKYLYVTYVAFFLFKNV